MKSKKKLLLILAVFGYTYHEGQAADLGAGYEQMAYFSGTFRYIQVPRIR